MIDVVLVFQAHRQVLSRVLITRLIEDDKSDIGAICVDIDNNSDGNCTDINDCIIVVDD